jgi:hypothetical protein
MSERDDAISDLRSAGVLAGLGWAWRSAWVQTVESYTPDTGHTQGWLGYNAFTVLQDRLNRVFSLGRFGVSEDMDPTAGADFIALGLTSGEFERMPHVLPGAVVRDDLNCSPGWRRGNWRILLQSFGGVEIDRIPWAQKSWTKRRVAGQPAPDQPMLPPDILELPMATDVLADLSSLPPSETAVVTLVGAYSISAVTLEGEFHIGHPCLAGRGEDAWHWRYRLEDGNSGPGRGMPTSAPGGSPANPVPDAPVRLRRPDEGKSGKSRSSGQQ